MTLTTKGTDADCKPIDAVRVYEKQQRLDESDDGLPAVASAGFGLIGLSKHTYRYSITSSMRAVNG
jgi:hypothetical protein